VSNAVSDKKMRVLKIYHSLKGGSVGTVSTGESWSGNKPLIFNGVAGMFRGASQRGFLAENGIFIRVFYLQAFDGILWKKEGAGRKGVMEEWSGEQGSGEWRVGESQAESRKLQAAS
jgi:hypothetical protein